MNSEKTVLKINDVTVDDIVHYLRIELEYLPDDKRNKEEKFLELCMQTAKRIIINSTGIDKTKIDDYEDLVIALYILVSDMYENRSISVNSSNINKVLDMVLGSNCENLL